jgi:hypothetical protein
MATDGITPLHGPTDHPKHPQFIMAGGDRYYIASGPDKSAEYRYYNGHWYNIDQTYRQQQLLNKQLAIAAEQMRLQSKYQDQSLAAQQEYNDQMAALSAPQEPSKRAADASENASMIALERQQRRRGLLSTFTRYGQGGAMTASDTTGKATVLGG